MLQFRAIKRWEAEEIFHIAAEEKWIVVDLNVVPNTKEIISIMRHRDDDKQLKGRLYDNKGNVKQEIPIPTHDCQPKVYKYLKILSVQISGKPNIAISCKFCHCIWLWREQIEGYVVAWTGARLGKKQMNDYVVPWSMTGMKTKHKTSVVYHGKNNTIIAVKEPMGHTRLSTFASASDAATHACIYDKSTIPFKMIVSNMEIPMTDVRFLSYCELPEVGEALVVADYFSLCTYKLVGESLQELWRLGGQHAHQYESVVLPSITGLTWEASTGCIAWEKYLCIADNHCFRIVLFEAKTSEYVCQIFQSKKLGPVVHLGWVEETQSLIVVHRDKRNTHHVRNISIEF